MKRTPPPPGLTFYISLLVFLVLIAGTSSHALTVSTATIKAGAVYVSGSQAAANAQIFWEGEPVGVANRKGAFSFSTLILPPTCIGELSDGVNMIDVVVQYCGPMGEEGPPGPPGPTGGAGLYWSDWTNRTAGS